MEFLGGNMVRLDAGEKISGQGGQIGPLAEAAIVRVLTFDGLNFLLVQLGSQKIQIPGSKVEDIKNSISKG